MAINNPYVPGDPFSYDLKWLVRKIKEHSNQINELTQEIAGIVIPDYTEITTSIMTFGDFEAALRDDYKGPIIGKLVEITQPIDITDLNLNSKQFLNCVFVLHDDMFTWANAYRTLPRFNNCYFYGNGNAIVKDGLYIVETEFINCIFENISLILNAEYVQTTLFDSCRFVGNKTLIDTLAGNVITFRNCVCESDFTGQLLVSHDTPGSRFVSIGSLTVEKCMLESQTRTPFVIVKGGNISLINSYFEVMNAGIADFPSTTESNPILRLLIENTSMSSGRDPFFNIASGFQNKARVRIKISNSFVDSGAAQHVFNSYSFLHFISENNVIGSANVQTFKNNITIGEGASVFPGTNSAVIPQKECPAFLIWTNSVGGWHTDIAMVNKASSTWEAFLITDRSITFPVTENADGTVTINISSRPSTAYGSNFGRNYVSLHNVLQKAEI